MSYRQTKLPDLIAQANPQELLTHFIFFKLKERATYLKTSFFPEIQSIKEKYHISKGEKKRVKVNVVLFTIPFSASYGLMCV